MSDSDRTQYAIAVTLSADEAPEGEQLRRVGPYANPKLAGDTVAHWQNRFSGARAPEGTTFDVVEYDPSVEHRDPRVPVDSTGLALLMQAEPDEARFPTLFDLLRSSHPYSDASDAWRSACALADHWAEEQQQEEELDGRFKPVLTAAGLLREGMESTPAGSPDDRTGFTLAELFETSARMREEIPVKLAELIGDLAEIVIENDRHGTAKVAA